MITLTLNLHLHLKSISFSLDTRVAEHAHESIRRDDAADTSTDGISIYIFIFLASTMDV